MAERAALSRSLHVVSRSAVLMVALLLAVPDDAKAGQAGAVLTGPPDSLPGALPTGARDGAYGNVRALDTRARDLIEQATQASPTVAALIAALGKTDVLVLVRVTRLLDVVHALGRFAQPRYAGATQLVPSPAGYRVLLVTLEESLSQRQLIMYLGHELQHAKEIADALDVRDAAALRRLMNRIGWPTGGTFETKAAIRVGWQVWREAAVANSRK
jgi:hypothetical protein